MLTKSATTALIQFVADYFAQGYEEAFLTASSDKTNTSTSLLWSLVWVPHFDFRRGLSWAADGMFLSGPLLHYAYDYMESIIPTENNGSSTAAVLHVLANDYLIDTLYLFISFIFVAVAEGHARNLLVLFRKDFFATLQASWAMSVLLFPVEYVCFSRLPIKLRVPSMNFIDVVWGAIVSFVAHRSRRQPQVESSTNGETRS